jgi:peptidoglycan/LPS O-acetylase OafA/YrhL
VLDFNAKRFQFHLLDIGTRKPVTELSSIPKQNNMDFLRLVFASMVVFAHCYDLSESPALLVLRQAVSSGFAVKGFFVLSGFLVVSSYENCGNVSVYAKKRALRIYPAYFTVIVLCTVLGATITSIPLSQYFSLPLFRYLGANLIFLNFLEPSLPGVFDAQGTSAVNGALWTIKVEVAFYIAVPVIVYSIHRFGLFRTVFACYVASLLYSHSFNYLQDITKREIFGQMAKFMPGQLTYFLSGTFLYYRFDWFKQNKFWLLPFGLVLYSLDTFVGTEAILPIGVGLIVVSLAFGPYCGNAGRYGDFSYGIYIWHFPIVQTLIWLGFFTTSPYIATTCAYLLALASAYLSWHAVEKIWLYRSSHYVEASQEGPLKRGPSLTAR